ncbi:MAG: 2-hydroxyacid dehydrogenase, partial [Halomonas sp.]
RLTEDTAPLAKGFDGVCAFVNDCLDAAVLHQLHNNGTSLVALRSAGFNHVDLAAAERLGMTVVRVPAYSPHAVAEHAVALVLSLNRMTYRAYNRVREGNFALDGLLGFDLYGKTVGVIGTGQIGLIFADIMHGFGCRIVASDPFPNPQAKPFVEYLPLEALYAQSDIISLHCPLTPDTNHLIDADAIAQMKQGVMLINTGRGRVVDTQAVIANLKNGKIGHLGLDVYEEEEQLFFEDLSHGVIDDDQFMRLTTFHNVLITGHQAFFTTEALTNIAETTLANIDAFESGSGTIHRVVNAKLD